MENKLGRKKLKEKDKASIIVPVRLTPLESKMLARLAKDNGEVYATRMVRRLIQEAIKLKDDAHESLRYGNRPG